VVTPLTLALLATALLWQFNAQRRNSLQAADTVKPAKKPAAKAAGANKETEKQNASDAVPTWIWSSQTAKPRETAYFRKIFQLNGKIRTAVLASAVDNSAALFLNGQFVAQHNAWNVASIDDVSKKLKEGANAIAVRAENADGPAGLLVQISVEFTDGRKQKIVTGSDWTASTDPKDDWRQLDYPAKGWTPAVALGKVGVAPWGKVNLTPGAVESTPVADIVALPGFKVERLYSVPKETQGSWVAMTHDPKGRLLVSDQYGGLFRITPGKDEESTKVEKLSVAIGEAQGLLYAFDSLYVTVNGNAAQGSGFYRVRDTNGDDQFDEVKLLKKFQGAGEHGPHAIRLGPNGKLYVIAGNHTKVPEGLDPASPHRNWGEDLLLPRNPDGNGHATGVMAPGGWIARTDKDGKNWDLFCAGFRNQYDIDFNQDGELFSYDADMEYDTGAPWYRPTRVNHAVSAAEFGWRFGTGKWPDYYADSVGAVIDIGLGSPTGVSFGTGAKFPARYQRAFFILDWTYGKLYAVHMQPNGASYSATFETFVEGKPLPLTDITVNTDGALYFTIGGRKTQSGLYRVTYVGQESTAPAGPIVNPAATAARQLRRQLEVYHSKIDPKAIELAWPLLNSRDRALRYAARVAIERQPIEQWVDKAFAESRINGLIQAMLAVSRTGKPAQLDKVLARLNQLPFSEMNEEQLLDALRTYQLAYIRLGGHDAGAAPLSNSPQAAAAKAKAAAAKAKVESPKGTSAKVEATASQPGEKSSAADTAVKAALRPLFPHQSEFVNRELLQVLVFLEDGSIVEPAMNLLRSAQTQQDQMFYVFVLRNLKSGWKPEVRRAYFSWIQLAETRYRGGASFVKFLQQIRRDAVEKLTDAEKVALKDVIEGKEVVQVVKLETTRQFLHNWQLSDLQPLLGQAGTGRDFEKGRLAYEATQCAKCHRFNGSGGDTGPDITGVGNRFDANYILESFIVPSKVISDQYRQTTFVMTSGKVVTGRVLSETKDEVLVRTDPFAKAPTRVIKAEIEERQPSPTSEMPTGLINVLTKDEILDLIAYLRSAGNPKDKMFLQKGSTEKPKGAPKSSP